MYFRRPCSQERRGFTLVELMVVVVIIGIVSGVMVAEMSGTFEDALLRTTARKLIDACDAASNRAIARHEPQAVQLEPKTGRFVVRGTTRSADPGSEDIPAAAGELDTRVSVEIRMPKSDEAAEDEAEPDLDSISFYPDGAADRRDIFLKYQSGELLLRINPATSRIRVIEEMTAD